MSREPQTGLAPMPYPKRELTPREKHDAIGTVEERCAADGYDVDAVLAASSEFRAIVGGVPFRFMTRGEAIHIARALRAVAPGLDLTDPSATEAGGL